MNSKMVLVGLLATAFACASIPTTAHAVLPAAVTLASADNNGKQGDTTKADTTKDDTTGGAATARKDGG